MAKKTKRTNKKKYQRKTRKIVGGLPDDLPPGTYTETTTLFTDKDTGNLTNILKHDIKSKESIDGFYNQYGILPLTILQDDSFFNYDFEKISKNAYDNTQSFFEYGSDDKSNNETKSYDLAINTNNDVSDFITVIQKFRTCLTDNSGGFLAILNIQMKTEPPYAIDVETPASEIKKEDIDSLKTYFETIISTIQDESIDMTYDEDSMKINTDSPNAWSQKEFSILKKPEYLENACYVVGQVFGIVSPDRKTHIFEKTEEQKIEEVEKEKIEEEEVEKEKIEEEEVEKEKIEEDVEKQKKVLDILKKNDTYKSLLALFNP